MVSAVSQEPARGDVVIGNAAPGIPCTVGVFARSNLVSQMENDKRIAYSVIAFGICLAAAFSVVPHYEAGHRLAFGLLLWHALPYYAYLLLAGILSGTCLTLPGISLLLIDLLAKGYARLVAEPPGLGSAIELYLPVLLLFVVLPAGYAIGKVLARRQSAT